MTNVVFKFQSCDNAMKCLVKESLWFSKPENLNDKFEARFGNVDVSDFSDTIARTWNGIESMRDKPLQHWISTDDGGALDAIFRRENAALAESLQESGIFSAARRPDNQAMWAHYADGGKGVCFEISIEEEMEELHGFKVCDVVYSDDARRHNRADDLRDTMLAYATAHPDANRRQCRKQC